MRFIYTKTFGIFAVCVIIVFLFVVLQIKGWLDPVRDLFLQMPRPVAYVARSVTVPAKNFVSTIYGLRKISKENAGLTSKVLQLQQDLVQYDQEKRENEALRKELGFVREFKGELASCMVLSRNPVGLTDTIVLNCGTDEGVEEGQAAISQGYLAGKIIYAGKNTSTVILVTSSKFSTDARISKTNAGAVVRGSFGSGLILDQLSQNENLEKGWLIVTAGINEKIPRNILIGEVGEIVSGPNEMFKKATLLSPVDFNGLEFVFVARQ